MMAPTKATLERRLREALQSLQARPAEGPKSKRIEAVVDDHQDAAIAALAELLGGRMGRSKAIRVLIDKGCAAMLAEMTDGRREGG